MVEFFDTLYSNIGGDNIILKKFRIYSLIRFLVLNISNIVIRLYYIFDLNNNPSFNVNEANNRYIVSLTSYPKRINTIWITIESILRQSYKPNKVILWLSKCEFDSIDILPKRLLKLQKRGLEIYLVDNNFRSHKKYLYAFKYHPDKYIITIDDDIVYPEHFLSQLINLSKRFPNAICTHRGHEIKKNVKGELLPYNTWPEIKNEIFSDSFIFFTTGGGTIFPPHSLFKDVLKSEIFMDLCPYADDVWLNVMASLNKTKVVKSSYYSVCLSIVTNNSDSLSRINVNESLNDKQLQKLISFYNKFQLFA